MSQYTSFEELEATAKASVEGMKKRPAIYEGIKQQITDPYTDNAHFIFELLQNAEDMKSSTVCFRLENDCLYFEHNGTKRDFNLDDIDAITSISNNLQKQDDGDVIGKFGIGFKAVFLYTETPIIHSGDYHFKIVDLFIPSREGVEPKQTVVNGAHWTKFELPFNAKTKSPNECFDEIREALLRLDYSSLLFLRNICCIEINVGDERRKLVKTEEPFTKGASILHIGYEGAPTADSWIRFSRIFEYEEKGHIKRLPISLAYRFAVEDEGRISFLPVADGRSVYTFFPAEKEDSRLQFPINGPFITTSARNALKSQNPINNQILQDLAELVCVSLGSLKDRGWLNPSFLRIMPNASDNVTGDYALIYNKIIGAFTNDEYVPALEGGYVPGNEASMWTRDGMKTLTDADMAELGLYKNMLGIALTKQGNRFDSRGFVFRYIPQKLWMGKQEPHKRWVPSFRSNDRVMTFYESINVFNVEAAMHDAFNQPMPNLDIWIGKQTKRKIADFYLLLKGLAKDDSDCFPQHPVAVDLNGVVRESSSITWSKGSEIKNHTSSHIFDPFFLTSSKELRQEEADAIFSYITKNLGIREYSDLEEMRAVVAEINVSENIDNAYFDKLDVLLSNFGKLLSKYPPNDIREVYSDIKFWCNDESFHLQNEISLGSAYGNERNELFASVLKTIGVSKPLMSDIYQDPEKTNVAAAKSLFEFLKLHNILEITENKEKWAYPLYRKIRRDRENCNMLFKDFTIAHLEGLLALQNLSFNRELMAFLCEMDTSLQKEWLQVSYRPNNKTPIIHDDSSLIHYLKSAEWVLGKDGRLHRPSDVFLQDVDEPFDVDESSPVIKALKFGSSLDEEAMKEKAVREYADSKGLILLTQEESLLFEKFKEARRKSLQKKSYQDALDDESKAAVSPTDPQFETDVFGGVSNPEKRQSAIEEELSKAVNNNKDYHLSLVEKRQSFNEEKITLGQWYGGKCQVCGTLIKKRNGQPFFEATNIVETSRLADEYTQHNDLCWNSLCLCPNCSAKYRYSQKDVHSIATLSEMDFDFESDELHSVPIVLAGEATAVKFTSKHLLAIQTAQRKYKSK